MILSNEPGYYKAGAYGIRIENLVLVVAAPEPEGGEKPLNAFETLTLAPIDRRLIDTRMLTAKERNWIDSYHARVNEEIARWSTRRRGRGSMRPRGRLEIPDGRPDVHVAAAEQASHPVAPFGAADGDDRHRAGHAQYFGAGAARAGDPARLRHRHRAADAVALSAEPCDRPTAARAAVRPLRPPAGSAGRADAERHCLARRHRRVLDRRADRRARGAGDRRLDRHRDRPRHHPRPLRARPRRRHDRPGHHRHGDRADDLATDRRHSRHRLRLGGDLPIHRGVQRGGAAVGGAGAAGDAAGARGA